MNTSKFTRRGAVAFLTAFTASGLFATHGMAQPAYPVKPITLLIPFAAGGATDVVGRLIGKKLGERLKQTVVIENAGGAGGLIGASKVARASPDGYTLLMGTVATHALSPLMTKQPTYNAVKDFTPISLLVTVPNVLLVGPKFEASTVSELIALLKANPGKYSYGTSGPGTPPHLSGELFQAMAGVKMEHVPYRGGAPAIADLIGGQIPMMFDVLSGSSSFLKRGAVKALAVTTKSRSPSFPDIPTVAESGLPGYETYTWNAVFGPAGLPPAVVQKLSSELREVMADPEIIERMKELSADPVGSTPEELANLVKSEIEKWTPIVESAKVTLN